MNRLQSVGAYLRFRLQFHGLGFQRGRLFLQRGDLMLGVVEQCLLVLRLALQGFDLLLGLFESFCRGVQGPLLLVLGGRQSVDLPLEPGGEALLDRQGGLQRRELERQTEDLMKEETQDAVESKDTI